MITTPSMGLKRWDQPNDVFSYVELSDNFGLLDVHDHSAGKGVQIPTAGIQNNAVDATKLANNAVTNAKIAAATITDASLASPNNNTYKTMTQSAIMVSGAVAASTVSGIAIRLDSAGAAIRWNPAEFSVPNKTTQWRLNVGLVVNATAPASNFTVGIYPVTGATGGGTTLTYTLGAAVGTVLFTTPAAGSVNMNGGVDFASPASIGLYALAVVNSATTAAGSMTQINAQLQMHHV